MKRRLTALTIALVGTTLFGCNKGGGDTPTPTPEVSKITSVKVQAIPYALNNVPYKLNVTVEGEGKFSSEVTWTSDNEKAHISNGFFIYTPDQKQLDDEEVVITATSVQDNTKKASIKISVIAIEPLSQEDFKKVAEAGDKTRDAIQYNVIEADHGKDDFMYVKDKGSVSIDYAAYKISSPYSFVTLKNNELSKSKNAMIHTAAQLDNAFNNQFKDCTTWFAFTDSNINYYGYYVYKPAMSETEEDLSKYSVFQANCGLPVCEVHIEGEICYTYLNLTPKL